MLVQVLFLRSGAVTLLKLMPCSYGSGEYGELSTYCRWTRPCKLRASIWQFAVNHNTHHVWFAFKTMHHEQWFHYKDFFVNLLWNRYRATFLHLQPFFHKWWILYRLENLQFTGGVHQLWSQLNTIHPLWSGKHHIHQFIWMQHYSFVCAEWRHCTTYQWFILADQT